jgi:hypothetical protein
MLEHLIDFFREQNRRDRWQRKRRVGHKEGLTRPGFYYKAAFRLNRRSLNHVTPAKNTEKLFASSDSEKSRYQIYSDGSLRKMLAMKGGRHVFKGENR